MRPVMASDTHERHTGLAVPDGDVFVHAGDFTMVGDVRKVAAFGAWVRALPHRTKIIIAGNHDRIFEERLDAALRALGDGRDGLPQTDVLITHGPPMGTLDFVHTEHVGCADLRDRVHAIKPQVHVFGHIHDGSGIETSAGTILVNACICDEDYRPTNPCRVIDI